jgi:hypothetical protein
MSPAAQAATQRSFSCTGHDGPIRTTRTVTGQLTVANVPIQVQVFDNTGVLVTTKNRAQALGSSWLHTGYTQWDITGAGTNGDLYSLHIPPVLPGGGGFFDADLEIAFAVGGEWQIPMFDCTVTGGPAWLASGGGPRSFSCAGNSGDIYTGRVVTGRLTTGNVPVDVTVTATYTGAALSHRAGRGTSMGASWLHAGYTDWDVTRNAAPGETYHLHLPPVLPRVGGFFDADLEESIGLQTLMFDCTVA